MRYEVPNLRQSRWTLVALFSLLLLGVCWLSPEAAMAAPGGIIKAAAKTPFMRVIFGILTVIFLPIIIYYSVKGAMAVRKTRQDLAKLASAYPQYRWLDLQDRITDTFSWTWSAWTQGKMNLASEYTTSWYWQNQQLQLDDWERQGLENVCRLVKLQRITPIMVQHSRDAGGEGSRVVVCIKARVVDYLQNKATGAVVSGDKKEDDLETIWTFMWSGGKWCLNKIEPGVNEFEYLFAPNEVPETLAQPAKA